MNSSSVAPPSSSRGEPVRASIRRQSNKSRKAGRGRILRMKLYTYWRSLATFRVRIALNLKGLSYEPVYVDLDAGDQRTPAFKTVNPQMVIPALVEDDGNVLFQSLAILEYLNEIHPNPPLLPTDPRSEEHTSELQSLRHLVCRLLLEK